MPLLLSPHRLLTDHIIIESIHINKTPKGAVDLVVEELSNAELKKHYPQLPKPARDIMIWFSKGGVAYIADELKTLYELKRNKTDFESHYRNEILRKLHDLLLRLKPFAATEKWYHKIPIDKRNYKTGPCKFSNFRPYLEFQVTKETGNYFLKTFINLNGEKYPLEALQRTHFLLESRSEYFLLAFKDYQTLEWLEVNDPGQYKSDPEALATNILTKLEEDYRVNRNNLFETTKVDTIPVNRVMLSEISGSFLMLTPQWLYDGFLQEGSWKEKTDVITGGKTYCIYRNKEEETKLVHFLESLHPNFPKQLNGYYYLSFADAQKKQWFAKTYHKLLDLGIEVVGMDMLKHFRYSPHKATTATEIKEEAESIIKLNIKVTFGEEEIALNELQKILYAGQKAVLLKDGSLGLLDDEWLVKYSGLIKHGKIEKKSLIVGRWMALGDQVDTDKRIIKKEWWNKWEKWQSASCDHLYTVPAEVKIEGLRPYQQKGYEWLRLLAEAGCSGCLADDMGLGKTLQTICFIVSRLEVNSAAKHLVVCPSSLMYNWQQELNRFAPAVNNIVYHGGSRNIDVFTDPKSQLIITSYGTMRSDIEKMREVIFDTIVVDESHNIKNPSALTTRAINELRSITRVALSGTPVMNNTFDLYGQLNFLLPGMLGSREFFKREYADPIDRERDQEKIKALQKITGPFILRRTKEQVATDLPEKTETILWCEMDGDQRFAYDSIKENIKDSLFLEIKDKGFNSGKLSVLHGIMKLRQVCNSCELVKDENLFTYNSIKTKVLIEELKNIYGNHKALVFSQFTSMLDILERDLTSHNIDYFRLDGSTQADKRQDLVNQFNSEDSDTRVFLLSLKAGNAGLNLTSADYVFLFDPWWNKAVEQQAIDRTHRIGQTKNVFAYKMICRNTIEEKIVILQQRKSKLSEELIGGDDDGFVKNLSEEDVEFLFS
jgi:SNF2 family DNA or RNA helicase